MYRSAITINKDRAYAYPDFIDAHCHFSGLGLTSYQCELKGTRSYQEVITKLVEYEKLINSVGSMQEDGTKMIGIIKNTHQMKS